MRISDWSSDVCSSDLCNIPFYPQASEAVGIDNSPAMLRRAARRACRNGRRVELLERDLDRKSVVEGKSVSVRVDLGGRRLIKKKKISDTTAYDENNITYHSTQTNARKNSRYST